MMTAAEPFEEFLENSGLLRFNADAYLEEIRLAPPVLRDYYRSFEENLQKYQHARHRQRAADLDAKNRTDQGGSEQGRSDQRSDRIASEFEALAAEYHDCQKGLKRAQANFEANENGGYSYDYAWEDLGALGEDRPSKEAFDLDQYKEKADATHRLREAENRMAGVRARLRVHIPLSDLDSVIIPEHPQVSQPMFHAAEMRSAKADKRIERWFDDFSEHELGPPPLGRSKHDNPWTAASVGIEDSYSHRERREYESKRAKAFKKLKTAQDLSSLAALQQSTGSQSSGKRTRSPSALGNDERPEKRQKTPAET